MAIKTGTFGLVQISPLTTILNLQNWSLSRSTEIIDATVLGATGVRAVLPTFSSWSVTAEGFWDPADTTGQDVLRTASANRTLVTLKLYPSATNGVVTSGDDFYTGSAYINSEDVSGSFDNLVKQTFSFEGSGALTMSVAP